MNEATVLVDAMIAQIPLLLAVAAGNERVVEMTLALIKKVTKLSSAKVKDYSMIIAFVTGVLVCSYGKVVLIPGASLEPWLNTMLAGALVSLGTKGLHDIAEWLGAVAGTAKNPVSNATRSKF